MRQMWKIKMFKCFKNHIKTVKMASYAKDTGKERDVTISELLFT